MTWHPDLPLSYRDQIVTGDARILAREIPDESVDLIFTDPPYTREVTFLYGDLGRIAARVLKPDGFCFALCGLAQLDEVMRLMSESLSYFWTLCEFEPGSNSAFNPRRIVCKWRPIVAFSKGFEPKHNRWLVDGRQTCRDKRYHEWGQSIDFPRMCIEMLTRGDAFILDPFTGGGTVPAVCKMLGRHYVAFEIDPATAERARERVANTTPPLPGIDEPEQLEMEV